MADDPQNPNPTPNPNPDPAPSDPPANPEPAAKTFTQADIDRVVQQRLARERKEWEAKLDEERKQASMSEAEKLKAQVTAAEAKATEAANLAAQRVIRAEAKLHAVALGIKPERADMALRLADLSGVELGDDGEPDAGAIKTALEKVLADLPELKGAANGAVGGGSNPANGSGNATPDVKTMSSNDFAALQKRILNGERIAP